MAKERELLELAAKAAGIEYQYTDDGGVIEYFGGGLQIAFGGKWSPLTDDGDALRLATKLHIAITYPEGEACVRCWIDGPSDPFYELLGDDPDSATRRAIVRAAAEIGATK